MQRIKSFENDRPTLFIVATPIGNLSEISNRCIEILNRVDVIACEDTRVSINLLNHLKIKKPLISYHNYNEKDSSEGIIKLLQENKNVALISDAGYPLISDPGYNIVTLCIKYDFNVVAISGASAALNALVASGLDTSRYLFFGFLSNKEKEAVREIESLKTFPYTIIFYESVHRINKNLNLMANIFGDRYICIARELTKKHEEYIRGSIFELKDLEDLKGEMVVVVEGYKNLPQTVSINEAMFLVDNYVKSGMSVKDAISEVAKKCNIAKKVVYNNYHKCS